MSLTPKQEERAIKILLDHIDDATWDSIRKVMANAPAKWAIEGHLTIGMTIRNVLRLYGFLDNESSTHNLDDEWAKLTEKAAFAILEQADFPKKPFAYKSVSPESEKMGDLLWGFCEVASKRLYQTIIDEVSPKFSFNFTGNEQLLKKEIYIVTMWMITWLLKSEKLAPVDTDQLNAMHNRYFLRYSANNCDEALLLKKELDERYTLYFRSYLPGNMSPVRLSMLSCILETTMPPTFGIDVQLEHYIGEHLTAILALFKEEWQRQKNQYLLAFRYYSGDGVEKDFKRAVALWTAVAELGEGNSQDSLARCYYTGDGVERDLKKTVFWFTKAAEQGHPEAQCFLATLYATGEGVELDSKKAILWATKAAEQGDVTAKRLLAALHNPPQQSGPASNKRL